ncbi:hypothetical protein CsatA_025923 [Cannabis sativa]
MLLALFSVYCDSLALAESLTVAFPVSRAPEVNRVQRTLVEAWGLIRETSVDPTFNHQDWDLNAIAYVELDDNTKSLSAVMFADIVKKIFSCNAAQLMKYTAEEHRRFVDTTIFNLSKKKWIIQIYADPARMKSTKYKNYTIVSIKENED